MDNRLRCVHDVVCEQDQRNGGVEPRRRTTRLSFGVLGLKHGVLTEDSVFPDICNIYTARACTLVQRGLADVSWHETKALMLSGNEKRELLVDERQVRYGEIIVTQEFTA